MRLKTPRNKLKQFKQNLPWKTVIRQWGFEYYLPWARIDWIAPKEGVGSMHVIELEETPIEGYLDTKTAFILRAKRK